MISFKKSALHFVYIVMIFATIFLFGCGGSDDVDVEEETTAEIELEEETTIATQETTQPETTEADRYADSLQYLSGFEIVEGGGYQATVSDDIKGDFTEIRNCALYTMKKAYTELQTTQMAVFGYFEDGMEPAFWYESELGDNQIYIYDEGVSPKGWQWVLEPYDWEYILDETLNN